MAGLAKEILEFRDALEGLRISGVRFPIVSFSYSTPDFPSYSMWIVSPRSYRQTQRLKSPFSCEFRYTGMPDSPSYGWVV